jgi:competence ComEA-like helix-hairpin-helix protein
MISVRVRQSGTSNYVEYRGSIVIAGTPRAPAQEEVQERDDTSEEKGTPAPKVSVQYPSTVRVGEEFTVSLSGEHLESIQYDVKIAVEDAGVISRTWRDGGWSSSQYYVASALAGPAGAAELRLVVPEKIAPAAMLSVRLRKSGSSSSFVVHEGVIRIDAALTPEELPPDNEIEQTEPPQESESPPTCININTASESELDGITGIGPVLATRIVEERALMLFISLDDLTRVSGIGPTAVGKIKAEGKACI